MHKSNTNREHSVQLMSDGFSAFNLCLHGSVMFIIPSTRLQSLGIGMYTHLLGFLSPPTFDYREDRPYFRDQQQ